MRRRILCSSLATGDTLPIPTLRRRRRPRRRRPPRRRRRRGAAAAGAPSSVGTTVAASSASGSGRISVGSSLVPTSRIIPERLTSISLMRRRRVMSRGEPGGRRKPRDFKPFESASIVTPPSADAARRSRTTAMISSCGAVWPSGGSMAPLSSGTLATGAETSRGAPRGTSRRPPRRPPRRRRRERPSLTRSSGASSATTPRRAR